MKKWLDHNQQILLMRNDLNMKMNNKLLIFLIIHNF